MLSATRFQVLTYLFGVCLFSISFLVFLNASVSFVITDLIKDHKRVGNAVGTLGFADELVALVACPAWGVLSDRVGVRTVCLLGYAIVGLSLFLFVQATNVFPQLLLARMFFSVGGAATTTMVTAILPAMTGPRLPADSELSYRNSNRWTRARAASTSLSSGLVITPARLACESRPSPTQSKDSYSETSPTRLAGLVGALTGCGALVALGVFLPLPGQFQQHDIKIGQAWVDTYYVVGSTALLVSLLCFIGLRNLRGEQDKTWRAVLKLEKSQSIPGEASGPSRAYSTLLLHSIRLGFQDPLIGLGYLGGFVARASSVGISLFIPLYVNAYFRAEGVCKIDDAIKTKTDCREAYILAAKLTGASQLVALLCAPVFGYLADKYTRFHTPLLFAATCGIAGYGGFAVLDSPRASGADGSPLIYVVVSLLGISQIGAIVCSLGLIGRGISGTEAVPRRSNVIPRDCPNAEVIVGTFSDEPDPQSSDDASSSMPHEDGDDGLEGVNDLEGLLSHKSHDDKSLVHLKGSIAGVYSLAGGAGILCLTKLGGFLFDVKSPASPFYILAVFNVLLFVGAVLSSILQFHHKPRDVNNVSHVRY